MYNRDRLSEEAHTIYDVAYEYALENGVTYAGINAAREAHTELVIDTQIALARGELPAEDADNLIETADATAWALADAMIYHNRI